MGKKRFFIGTSGFSYLHWRGNFYPEDLPSSKYLEYLTKIFNSVEINSSFYYLPQEKTFINWQKRTPKNFIFSVKASRFITHRKKLKDCKEPLKLFLKRARLLKKKLGVILFQFPPNFKKNLKRFKEFTKLLLKYTPHQYYGAGYTFEFRHPSWFCQEIYSLLKNHNFALTISDTPDYPLIEEYTASFAYFRFHGHKRLYTSNYSLKELKTWSQKIKKLKAKEVYIYFDNDAYGYAPKNAQTLKKLLT